MAEISVNDVGTELEFTVLDQDNKPVPLTGATVKLYVKRPDGTVLDRTCNIIDEGNAIVSYTVPTQNDLWNAPGDYKMWTVSNWGSSKSFKSNPPIIESIQE